MANDTVALTREKVREQQVIRIGAITVVVGLLLAYVILPFGRQWYARSLELRALAAQTDTLTGLVNSGADLEKAAAAQERLLAVNGRRVLHARSAALAASALQSLLQDASDASHLAVTRLDVAQNIADDNAPDSVGAPPKPSARAVTLPATLAAYCDIVGLAALLDHLARAPRIVYVDRLTVQQNPSLRGAPDMLQITVSLRAPLVLE